MLETSGDNSVSGSHGADIRDSKKGICDNDNDEDGNLDNSLLPFDIKTEPSISTLPEVCSDDVDMMLNDNLFTPSDIQPEITARRKKKRKQQEKKLKCGVCGQEFTNKDMFQAHLKTHAGDHPFLCSDCGKSFNSKSYLKRHRAIHTGKGLFKCRICGKGYLERRKLNQHIQSKCGVPVECPLCPEVCSNKMSLAQHTRYQHSMHDCDEACEICGETFTDYRALVEHLSSIHPHHQSQGCSVCGKTFLVSSVFKKHMERHGTEVCSDDLELMLNDNLFTPSDIQPEITARRKKKRKKQEKKLKCGVCGQEFTNKDTFQDHLKTHAGDHPFLCTDCGKSFNSKSYLKRHRAIHTGKGLFKCRICGKAYLERRKLNQHIQSKCGVPIECPLCPEVCSNKMSLAQHTRYQHSMQDSDEACEICSETFTDYGTLVEHLSSVHPHHKSQGCSVCGQTFLVSSMFRKHMERHGTDTTVPGSSIKACDRSPPAILKEDSEVTHPVKEDLAEDNTVTDGGSDTDNYEPSADILTDSFNTNADCSLGSVVVDSVIKTEASLVPDEVEDRGSSKNSRLNKKTTGHKGVGSVISTASKQNTKSVTSVKPKIYKCDVCEKMYSDKDSFESHVRGHTGDRPFKCDDCGKTFTSNDYFKRHRRLHTGDRLYRCLVCDKGFLQRKSLAMHVKNKCGEPLQCPLCPKVCASKSSLSQHTRYHHTNKPVYTCEICAHTFQEHSFFVTHMRSEHADFKPFECPICFKSFFLTNLFQKHMQFHSKDWANDHGFDPINAQKGECEDSSAVNNTSLTSDVTNNQQLLFHDVTATHSCDICNQTFPSLDKLKLHVIVHTRFQCTFCEMSFASATTLEEHSRFHTGDTFNCKHCDKKFGNEDAWRRHEVRHEDGRHPCDLCEEAFSSPAELLTHTKEHVNAKQFQCQYCEKTFALENNLTDHMRYHSGLTYNCAYCGRKFGSKSTWRRHEARHKGVQQHLCDVCGKGFRSREGLAYHVVEHNEPGTSPQFQCDECPKTFTRAILLRAHKKRHTDAQPYFCDVCGKSFKLKYSFIYHVRKHEGHKYKCDCGKEYSERNSYYNCRKKHKGLPARTYTCAVCSKQYSSRNGLNKHKKSQGHTSERPV